VTKPFRDSLTLTRIRHDDHQEAQYLPLDMGLIRRLFTYTRPHSRLRNWLTLTVILRSIQLPVLAWSIGAIINGAISRNSIRGTLWGCVGFASLALFTQVTFFFRLRMGQMIGELVIHDIRLELFQHLLTMPMSFFNRTKLGRIISRMTSDVEAVRAGVQDVFFVGCVQGGQALVSTALMLWIDVHLFLVVMIMAPVVWALNQIFRKRLSEASRATQESFSRITATLAESVTGIRVTQGFARQSVNADLFHELVIDHSRYNLDVARTSGVFLPLLELSSQLVTAGLMVAGAYLAFRTSEPVAVGTLIQFFFLSGVFFAALQSLGTLYNQAMMSMAGAERVFRLLDLEPEWEDRPSARDLPEIRGHVECRGLTFGYDPTHLVLKDINLIAEPGQTIAIVGHTGSGKTSIINLIAKFYLPTHGEILIDGVSILDIKGECLHRNMAIIQQQNFLFTGTIMDNIRVGRPAALDEEVIDAARRLDCLDILESLPHGLQTHVGEHGSGLSLGQRQLVCFVRALLADPRILILDEATSSVDTMTEVRIQKALSQLLKGRTCFVIAHRLSTVRNANQVLVLDGGRVIERGTHSELLMQRGHYSNLYRQFARLGLGGRPEGTVTPPSSRQGFAHKILH
jgi:ATP-binding cassette subfamily B protein